MTTSVPAPLLNNYLKQLMAVYAYRMNNDKVANTAFSAASNPYAIGTSAPTAMQLAMEAMRAHTPTISGNVSKSGATGGFFDFLKKTYLSDPISVINPLAKPLIESGPVKGAIDILSRPMYAVGSGMQAQVKAKQDVGNDNVFLNPKGANLDPKFILNAYWQGLSGKNKETPSKALFYDSNAPGKDLPKPAKAVAGFTSDVLGDPLAYLPIGSLAKVIKTGTKVTDATAILDKLPKQPMLAIEAPPVKSRFIAGATGVEDKLNPVQFANEVQANKLTDLVRSTPVLEHPNLEVAPLYRQVEETVTERVPVTKMVEETVPLSPVAATPKQTSPTLSARRAIKMAIMQDPTYRIGNFTIEEMLRVARENPTRQLDIEKIINNEVNKVHASGDLSKVPLVGVTDKQGEELGLTLKKATDMLSKGHIPTNFKEATLKNAKGETVTLEQYLKDLGIGKSPTDSVFDFVRNPTKKITTTKTVFEDVAKTVTSIKRLAPAESITWAIQHSDRLSRSEINYLRAARTEASFNARVKELATKTLAGNFKQLQDIVEAHEKGLIPSNAWQEILDSVGAKDSKDLLEKAKKIFAITGPKKASTPKLEDFLLPADKIERFKGRATPQVWDNVVPVDQIIGAAAAGDTRLLSTKLPEVTSQLIDDVRLVLDESVVKNLVDPQDLKKYPWITSIKQAKRTSPTPREGVARNLRGWNKYAQVDMFRAIATKAGKDTFKGGLKGKELSAHLKVRPDLMYNRTMDAMNFAEAALKAEGVKFIAGTDNSGILLSLMDVLNSLDSKVAKKFLFTRGRNAKNIYPTKILDAAANYVQAALHEGSLDLASTINVKMFQMTNKGESIGLVSAQELDKAIRDVLPLILQRVNANYAIEAIKIGESVVSMTTTVIDKVIKKFTDPNVSMGEIFGDIVNRQDDMLEIGRKLKAPSDAFATAKVIGDSELHSAGVEAADLAEATTAKKFAGASKEAARKIGVKQQEIRASQVTKDPEFDIDLSDLEAARLQMGIFKANAPLSDKMVALKDNIGSAFYAPYGHEDLHYMIHRDHNVVQTFARMHRGIMAVTYNKAQEYATEYAARIGVPIQGLAKKKLAEAFKLLQQGTIPSDDIGMVQLMASMKQSLDVIFAGGRREAGSFAVRNGIFSDHLNRILERYGVDKQFRFKEGVPLREQINSWRQWKDVEDPLDILDRVHAAVQRATVEVTVGRDISATRHPWVSTAAKPGFSKIKDSKKVSSVFPFMDPDKYYSDDIIRQLPYLDKFLNNSVFNSGGLIRLYDQVLHMWKAGVTIYRPGHHVRNLVGDMGLSFLAGVTNPMVYKKALKVLNTRASSYKDWDSFKALISNNPAAEQSLKNIVVKINGKPTKVSFDEVYRRAFQEGLLPDYSILEDTAFNEGQRFMNIGGKSIRKPLGGKLQRFAGGVSQSRDHWVRIAHFIDSLEKGSFKNIDDAIAEAGKTVRKWHPDGSDLTAFERQVMRRIIPFYSWFRKAIPLVIETAIMKPGRFMVMPKASYNMAMTMGVDPDSLANPFPEHTLFPSWLQDNILGPQIPFQGNLYGINPGDPVSDLGSSYLSEGAGRDVLGSLTPGIRIPVELMSAKPNNYAQSLGTGGDIPTGAEYWDQQIPGLGYVANITNTEPLAGFQEQRDVRRGMQEPGMDEVALLNFLTGLGIKNYTKPNYRKSAEFEQRDMLRRAAQGG
jgi:hypothetical protein